MRFDEFFSLALLAICFDIFKNLLFPERFNGYDDGSLTPGRSQARSFANQQMDFYSWIEGFLSNTLGLDGKACIQRLICELAEAPVDERSLMGEILHRIIE